jgi:hypothetical protein
MSTGNIRHLWSPGSRSCRPGHLPQYTYLPVTLFPDIVTPRSPSDIMQLHIFPEPMVEMVQYQSHDRNPQGAGTATDSLRYARPRHPPRRYREPNALRPRARWLEYEPILEAYIRHARKSTSKVLGFQFKTKCFDTARNCTCDSERETPPRACGSGRSL